MKTITIARDSGNTIQLGSGVAAGDQVIQNPPDGIADGVEVRIAGSAPRGKG
jgi:hypothetical protein